MRKPLIVLTPCLSRSVYYGPIDIKSVVNVVWNFDYIDKFGGVAIMPNMVKTIEEAQEIMSDADGLFVVGGDDVNPELYGEEKLEICGAVDDIRDKSDMLLIRAAFEADKPILGICRGAQILNVYFGGTLYQDIKSQLPGALTHPDYGKTGTDHTKETSHKVKLEPGSPLANLMGKDEIMTNSLHHQGIKDLGKGVVPMGKTSDGLVESWYYEDMDKYIRCYQWHPEMITPTSAQGEKIVKDFLSACSKKIDK
jgi:putative glutamine amidotransferase